MRGMQCLIWQVYKAVTEAQAGRGAVCACLLAVLAHWLSILSCRHSPVLTALVQASGRSRGEQLSSMNAVLQTCIPHAVVAVMQGGNLLSGTLPDMSAMKALTDFNAPNNQISGTLPQVSLSAA